MKERKKPKKIKISKKSRNIILLISIILIVPLVSMIGINAFSGFGTGGGSIYLLSGDVIKNFEFDKFDGDIIPPSHIMYENKLIFESQNIWRLEQDDVVKITAYDVGNTTYLYYKVFMTNTINVFTNVRLDQMSEKANKIKEPFHAGHYRHSGIYGDHMFSWDSEIYWEHWEFGDIWNYNFDNNHFQGLLEMSFDIAPSPLPDIFGEYAYKKFDYIAVSSASVASATHGKMSEDVPEIITAIPEVYRDEYNDESGGDPAGNIKGGFLWAWDTKADLDDMGITQSFDAGLNYQLSGSMFPKNKDGTPIWDPRYTGESMTDCKIGYGIYSLSPVVAEYGGRLTWQQEDIETQDYYDPEPLDWAHVSVKLKKNAENQQTEYRQIALHGWNRYIQTKMVVAFYIWTGVEIEALTEDYEYLKLHYPEEYYDMLIWSSLVGGFGGGKQYTADPIDIDIFEDLFGDLFGDIGDIIMLIIVIAVIGIGGYIFLVVGVPALKARQMKKQYEDIGKRRRY